MKENTLEKGTILITGGTGKSGRRIAERLNQLGWPIRIGSRSATPAFDWANAATWPEALEGVKAAYIAFQPDLAVPEAMEIIRTFTQLATQSGVRQLVLLSGRGEPKAQACEQIIKDSGVDWTILRCSWFNQNFSEDYLLEPLQYGFVALPAGPVKEPFVDAEDIAQVAVAAFTQPGHFGQLYEITGPRLLSFAEAISEIALASGRSIQYRTIPMDDYTNLLAENGVPTSYIELLKYLFTVVLDGRNESFSDGVQRALGRKPTDFSEYARKTAASGIWQSVTNA